jgi:tetratricopeptide (TPR) repeat protein
VADQNSSKYCEEATRMLADLAYNHKDYTLALDSYTRLIAITNNPTTKLNAQVNLLRSAQVLGKHDIVVQHSQATLANSILPPEVAIEIHYYRAKAYLAQKKNEAAIDDLCRIAVDTRNIYGAEAKYLLAELYYNIRQYDKAEQEVLDYINVSTPHTYWLARSFILLSDVYMQKDKHIEAKQYLLSLKQSYTADDDIAEMIEVRLNRLNAEN